MTSDAFAREWVQAWNRRDLESLLACFAEDVEFRSPLAAKLLGEPSHGTRQGEPARVLHEGVRGVVRRALAHSLR